MKHLSTDEFIDALYGVGQRDAHVDACPECSGRLRQLRAMRADTARSTETSADFLAAQRRNIYARMGEQPASKWSSWAPALAAAVVVIAAGVFSLRPQTAVVHQEIDQAQLFSDVYSMQQSMEPIAAQPIDAIFDQDAK
jgi:anti-sigma factor RsiW